MALAPAEEMGALKKSSFSSSFSCGHTKVYEEGLPAGITGFSTADLFIFLYRLKAAFEERNIFELFNDCIFCIFSNSFDPLSWASLMEKKVQKHKLKTRCFTIINFMRKILLTL